jgi:hypothetical protein
VECRKGQLCRHVLYPFSNRCMPGRVPIACACEPKTDRIRGCQPTGERALNRWSKRRIADCCTSPLGEGGGKTLLRDGTVAEMGSKMVNRPAPTAIDGVQFKIWGLLQSLGQVRGQMGRFCGLPALSDDAQAGMFEGSEGIRPALLLCFTLLCPGQYPLARDGVMPQSQRMADQSCHHTGGNRHKNWEKI